MLPLSFSLPVHADSLLSCSALWCFFSVISAQAVNSEGMTEREREWAGADEINTVILDRQARSVCETAAWLRISEETEHQPGRLLHSVRGGRYRAALLLWLLFLPLACRGTQPWKQRLCYIVASCWCAASCLQKGGDDALSSYLFKLQMTSC